MRTVSSVLLLVSICAVSGCQSEQIDNTNPVGPDDPVGFSADVLPIFNQSCGGGGCHIGARASGVRLDSYQNVIGSSGFQYGRLIVEPGLPDQSPLVDKLGSDPEFGLRMPFGRSPLSGSEIAIIESWIEDGAEDN